MRSRAVARSPIANLVVPQRCPPSSIVARSLRTGPRRVERRTWLPVALALALCGCGGSSSDDSDAGSPVGAPPTDGMQMPGDTTDPGIVAGPGSDPAVDQGGVDERPAGNSPPLHGRVRVSEVVDDGQPVASDVSARFVSLTGESPLENDELQRPDDVCVPTPASGAILTTVPERIAADVDAGTSLILTGPGGTWATLVRTGDSVDEGVEGSVYRDASTTTGRIDGRIPSGLVLDIAGDGAFPALTAVALPDPQPTAGTFTPTIGSAVDRDTVFGWTPSEATGSRLRITLALGDRSIDCIVVDDGTFDAPQALVDSDETATIVSVTREATRIERLDNATLKLIVATDAP